MWSHQSHSYVCHVVKTEPSAACLYMQVGIMAQDTLPSDVQACIVVASQIIFQGQKPKTKCTFCKSRLYKYGHQMMTTLELLFGCKYGIDAELCQISSMYL